MRSRTWALVTDGVRARILRDLEDDGSPAPAELVSKSKSAHLRAFLCDRTNHSRAPGPGAQRLAVAAAVDLILRDMRDFARQTLGSLDELSRKRQLTRLAIFAAPRMLGMLRRDLPEALSPVVVLEWNLTLINLPEADLRRAVIRALEKEPQP